MSVESRIRRLELQHGKARKHIHWVPICPSEGQTEAGARADYEKGWRLKIRPEHEIRWVEVIDMRAACREYDKKRETSSNVRG